MTEILTELPGAPPRTFLDFPFVEDLDALDADIAILGIPFGMPYDSSAMANDQSRAPDAIRQAPEPLDVEYTRRHFDWDHIQPVKELLPEGSALDFRFKVLCSRRDNP